MTEEPVGPVKGHCPACGVDRWADIEGEHRKDYQVDAIGVSGTVRHRVLKCRGCDRVYFQRYESTSEDYSMEPDGLGGYDQAHSPNIEHWPPPEVRRRPAWFASPFQSAIDDELHRLLGEVYTALDNRLDVLAAIGVRTVFDRASELLGIEPSKTFSDKLADLEKSGKIGGDERKTLSVLTDAASAAAHRGWKPEATELDLMMDIIEAFIHRSFVLGGRADELKTRVPSRPARLKNVTALLRP
jgi:Domain of unknown function (DUF4145)